AEVLDEHVGAAHQTARQRDARVLADVDGDRPLVAVEALEGAPADLGRQAAGAIRVTNAVAAAGLLDLDHVGAHVPEQRGAPWTRRLVAEVDDVDAGERAGAGVRCHASAAVATARPGVHSRGWRQTRVFCAVPRTGV